MHFVNRKRFSPLLFIFVTLLAFGVTSCGSTPEEVEETGEPVEASGESSGSGEGGSEEIEIADEPVARVNGAPIFQTELERFVENNRRQMAQQGRELSEQDLVMLREQVLGGLINREVLLQQAGELGLEAQEAAVETQLANIRSQFGSEEEYRSALEGQNLSEEELRDNIQVQLTIDRLLQQEVYSNVEVTQEEKQSFYEDNQQLFQQPESVDASHILITTQGLDEEAKAEALEERVVLHGRNIRTIGREGQALDQLSMANPFHGAPILYSRETGSTMDDARVAWARNPTSGLVVATDYQRSGRDRKSTRLNSSHYS